ncbi:MAG: D-alanyl-D-alanine carboxypeptidase family protein [Microbacterium sp.]|uniref:D-alanyl-D-alanine carboxypeptidase family protein n=1 Tax=Microbacterium sp. TaxID=51671 RepID=UPI003F9ABEA6
MTSDDATPDTGTLTRRELRTRTGPTAMRTPVLPFGNTAKPTDASKQTDTDAVGEPAESDETPELSEPDADELLIFDGVADDNNDDDDDHADDVGDATDSDSALESTAVEATWADAERPATAFTWIDADEVEENTRPAELDATIAREAGPDLLAEAQLRPALLRPRWLVPLGTVTTLAIAYSVTMLLWPLHAVAPTVEAVDFETVPAVASAPVWPTAGSAGVSVEGISSVASTPNAASIASLTKVVTSLMVLDRMPLQPGEQGPEFHFTQRDSADYWSYRRANQSSLDVPVGGVLTEYQMLQGTLLGSANNYIDRLAREIWGSDTQFAEAATEWLADRGLSGITVVTPAGFDEGNVATPEALLRLGELAMQNPVFAEIVGTASAEIPGAGTVTNSNGMLADEGVIGIKTGTLVGWCLLTAKDVTIGDTSVRLTTAVLNQGSNDERLAVTRSLFAEVEASLAATAPAVPAGTVVGEVSSPWGALVDVVVDEDASVLLWNGAAADANVTFDLEDQRDEGAEIGSLDVKGPVDATSVGVSLAEEIASPSPWWRLTHPIELLGFAPAD